MLNTLKADEPDRSSHELIAVSHLSHIDPSFAHAKLIGDDGHPVTFLVPHLKRTRYTRVHPLPVPCAVAKTLA